MTNGLPPLWWRLIRGGAVVMMALLVFDLVWSLAVEGVSLWRLPAAALGALFWWWIAAGAHRRLIGPTAPAP